MHLEPFLRMNEVSYMVLQLLTVTMQGMLKNPAEEDIRAAILRHQEHADEFKGHLAAYEKTQPVKIFAEEEKEPEEEDV